LVIGSSGCSGSDDETPTDRQESQSPTIEDTRERQQTASSPSETEQEKPMDDEKKIQVVRQEVQNQLAQAKTAMEKAEHLLQNAPTGKGSDVALAALQKELESAHNLLQLAHTQFDGQKFEMAQAQAGQAKGKAEKITQQIEHAMNTVTGHSP
jgi:hypothetical protein